MQIVATAAGVVTIMFFLFKAIPGDAATHLAGALASSAEVDALRALLGLDRPWWEQYARYFGGLAAGDFGWSSTFRGNPLPHIVQRLPATLLLAGTAIALTVIIGVPAGIIAAVHRARWPDHLVSSLVVALLAIPNFWLGLMLMAVLAVDLRLLPSYGFDGAASLVMPALALAARLIALVARMVRGVVIEELGKDYVRTARAKGLTERLVLYRHVLRNALIPVVTVVGLQAGYLLGGSVVIERLFSWPGVGDLLLNAVGLRDYPLVQGVVLIFALGFMVLNLAIDLLYRRINPRIAHG